MMKASARITLYRVVILSFGIGLYLDGTARVEGQYGKGMNARHFDTLSHTTNSFVKLLMTGLLLLSTLLASPELLRFPKDQALRSMPDR